MNPHSGRVTSRPQEAIMQTILAGHAWKARQIQNNPLRQHCHALARCFRKREHAPLKATCARLFTILETRSRVFHEIHPNELALIPAIIRLGAYEHQWVRRPEDWQPKSGEDAYAQWADFLRHVLARYPVPRFLDSAWQSKGTLDHLERDCWCALGYGRSLRQVKGFPSSVSNRVLHLALTQERGENLAGAIWQAQLQVLNVSPTLAKAVMASRVSKELFRHAIWTRLVAKFASGTDRDTADFPCAVCVLASLESQERPDQIENLLRLPLPTLIRHCMKYVSSLLQVNGQLFTEEQARKAARKAELSRLSAARWSPMLGSETLGNRNSKNHSSSPWRMEELCSLDDLKKEGHEMRHCVAGYARRCRQGSSAIFSLRHCKPDAEGNVVARSLATIEVHPGTQKIVQIRAWRNRAANNTCMNMIRAWASANHLA